MAGERLPSRFSLRSQLWFRATGKCFETATSHMQTVTVHVCSRSTGKSRMKILITSILIIICISNVNSQSWSSIDVQSIRPELTDLISNLAEVNQLMGEFTGPGAYTSQQYKNFESLLELCTEEDLIQLTNFNNPVVRSYAFWGLARQNSLMTEQIIRNHVNDDEPVKTVIGCTGANRSVAEFMLKVVTPDEVDDCLKLSNKTRRQIRREIDAL